MDLWERFGEPTWDFLVDVQIPLPEYFPYDIDDANCLASLRSYYSYGIEVRGDLESPDPNGYFRRLPRPAQIMLYPNTPVGQLTPFGPWLQYPPGLLCRYCWCSSSAK